MSRKTELPLAYQWCEPENYLGINWAPMGKLRSCHACWEAIPTYEKTSRKDEWTFEDLDECPRCGGPAKGYRSPSNLMPEPYKEIDEKEFLAALLCGDTGVQGTNYRGVHLEGESTIVSVHFFLFNNKCIAATYAFEYDWSRNKGEKGLEVGRRENSYYRLRFFRIGCTHPNMKEVSHEFAREKLGIAARGMHCHVSYCEDCGYRRAVDSSG